jgi:hypothetical protein
MKDGNNQKNVVKPGVTYTKYQSQKVFLMICLQGLKHVGLPMYKALVTAVM